MSRVIKRIEYSSRAITFTGTAVFASMGKYVTDFLTRFKGPGWVITSKEEHVEDSRKAGLLEVLDEMPEEAFGWFVVWAARGKPSGAGHDYIGQMFPDGIGGFSRESQASIEALRAAAHQYMESP